MAVCGTRVCSTCNGGAQGMCSTHASVCRGGKAMGGGSGGSGVDMRVCVRPRDSVHSSNSAFTRKPALPPAP